MADGFALRGFTQGFTQGLQNIDQLATNWQARDLKQKGYELEQQQQERANRYNDYLIQNMERDNARQDRQQQVNEQSAGLDKATKELSLQKQQKEMERQQRKEDLNRLYSVISPENPEDVTITDEDVDRMNRLGLRPFADYDPNKIKAWTDMLAKGEMPTEPDAIKALNDAYTVKAQRLLGRGITPGQQYTATGAETGEAVPRPGERVMPAVKTVVGMKAVDGGYVPIVRVEGATAGPEKRYVSYEAPYTENGMASPEDKPVRFTLQQMADTLRGAGFVTARLQANPALLERLRGQVVAESTGITKPTDPLTQSKISKIDFEKRMMQFNAEIKAKELQLKGADSQNKAALAQELANLRRAQTSFAQAQERALGFKTGQGTSPGLGSAKPAKPFELDRNVAKMWIDKFAPLPKIDPLTALPEEKKAFADAQNRQTTILADLTRAARMTRDMGLNATTDELVTAIATGERREMQVKGTNKYMRGYWLDGSFYPIQSYIREPVKPKSKSAPTQQAAPAEKDDFDRPTEKDVGAEIDKKYPAQPQAKGPALRDFTRGRS